MKDWRFLVCTECLGGKSDAVLDAVTRGCPDVEVVARGCLSVCTDPVTLAAQGPGRATYVFSGVTPDDANDVAAFAHEYETSPTGWIEDARPLGRLRFCLVARVPAIGT